VVLDDICRRISFGMGRIDDAPLDHPLFDDCEAWRAADAHHLLPMAQKQLGTVCAGNHYVDLFHAVLPDLSVEASRVWIGIHFGSRGLGHKLAKAYLKKGRGMEGIDVRPTLLHQDSDLGCGYLAAMDVAGRYAYAGREWATARVLDILGAGEDDRIHNRHNLHGARMWQALRPG
jgi:tRNA-splicing ligase RtcB